MSEDIDVGQLSEAINDKADRELNNTSPLADYVIESQLPTADNNYTWYRLYKSGWLEQGGKAGSSANPQVTLTKAYSSNNYTVCVVPNTGTSTVSFSVVGTTSADSFSIKSSSAPDNGYFWRTEGMSAQS